MSARFKRSKNLDEGVREGIAHILAAWDGKLTWTLLIAVIESQLNQRYSRQALHRHAEIFRAYRAAQKRQRTGPEGAPRTRSRELQAAFEKIERLRTENARFRSENDALLEQFARWAYNANTRGLKRSFLDQPLSPIDRGKTV